MNRPNLASANQRRAASRSAGTESPACAVAGARPAVSSVAAARAARSPFAAPSGWAAGRAAGDGASPGPTGNEKRETGHVYSHQPYVSPFPFPVSRVSSPVSRVSSQDSVHQRAEKHDDTDEPVGTEEGRVEPRQVSRLHQLVLPGDERRAERHPGVVGHTEPRADPEQQERAEGEPVQ